MALSLMLGEAGFTRHVHTTAKVAIEQQGGAFQFSRIHLETEAEAPGISQEKFREQGEAAKCSCPVSRALAGTPITLTTHLTEI